MVSVGIFLFFKNYQFTNDRLILGINFISKYSYGIYLVHVLILIFLSKIGLNNKLFNPILSIPLITFLCLTISGSIVFLLNKIPFGKYISG